MSDSQLRALLHNQLQEKPVDGALVRLILSVLKEREPVNEPEINESCMAAWDTFKEDCARDQLQLSAKPSRKPGKWLLKMTAAVAAVAVLILALPRVSGTENVVDMLCQWKESVFDFFQPEATEPAYVFKTDHPGLQELYDTVAYYGITQPVVPMWIEDEYVLIEIKTTSTPAKIRICAIFSNGNKELVFTADLYGTAVPHKYESEETDQNGIVIEISDIKHHVSPNNDAWVTVWTRDNLKCSLTVECSEDILYRMLKSIYKLEVL